MRMSEYAALHKGENRQMPELDETNKVSAASLKGEVFTVTGVVRVEKSKYDKPTYIITIQDGSWFFATDSITRRMDEQVRAGVSLDEMANCRYVMTHNHIDEHTDKTGKKWPACDFYTMDFVEEC